ncbi:MAG: glycoside hydrolase family 3 N-terminal domain-containing protein [Eubacteriales bacterium]|nr:glycoside hydrolase family 3 N-terminal domain-containing protein [Eubacteriales bacterium]
MKKLLRLFMAGLMLLLILAVKGESIAAGSFDGSASLRPAPRPKSVKFNKFTYGKNYVRLSWKPVKCDGYEISVRTEGKFKKIATIRSGKASSYVVKHLKPSSSYVYKINAYRLDRGGSQKTYSVGSRQQAYTKGYDQVEDALNGMTLHEKVCQMFLVLPEGLTNSGTVTSSGQEMKAAVNRYPVGGVIYLAGNLVSPSQTKTMINNIQSYSKAACGSKMFIAVDEEGGAVARCAQKLGTTAFQSMYDYRNSGKDHVKKIGSTIGRDIKELGFNVDFAPVADVNLNPNNELGTRIFSSNPAVVSKLSSAFVRGLQAQGVSATLKHFPGLGAAGGNTHYDSRVYITRTKQQLAANEFKAFQGGIKEGADFVMVGHATYSASGDNLPACLSKTVVSGWLRRELGFRGLAVTDSMSMEALCGSYTSAEAAKLAVKAGMDIMLAPRSLSDAVKGIGDAVRSGEISEERINESVRRILTVKKKRGLL